MVKLSDLLHRDEVKKIKEAALKIELIADEIEAKAKDQYRQYEKNKERIKELLKVRDKDDPQVRSYAQIAAMLLITSQRLLILSSSLKLAANQLAVTASLKEVARTINEALKSVKITGLEDTVKYIATFSDVSEFLRHVDTITNKIIQQISTSASEESVKQADKIIEIASTEMEMETKEGVSEEEIKKKISKLEREIAGL